VERSAALHRFSARLAERAQEYARIESAQCGKPIRLSTGFDVPGSIDNVDFFAGAARNLEGKAAAEWTGPTPRSSAGSRSAWSARSRRGTTLQMAMWKILPAIAAGNTIVLKPAEITPLTTLMVAEDALAAGIPAGVVNVVTGPGPTTGEALIGHPDVDMVSFTGSTPVGKRVMELATAGLERVHLELGGKAPFLVFDDADLEAAIHGAVAGALINTGQDCTAATRAYVQQPLFEAFVSGVADLLARVRLGDPMDEDTDLGPLISVRQQERVAGFVDRARQAGAKVVTGGRIPAGELARGAYYEPTLVTGAAQDSEIVQQEVFGPVLVALPFGSDDEGLALANDTPYGLAASAWSRDVFQGPAEPSAGCGRVAWINDHIPIVSEMPHGGFRKSGFGKEHVDVLLRGVHPGQARLHGHHRPASQGLAPDDLPGA
jgi:betaine-aldehyde dehydrogenase